LPQDLEKKNATVWLAENGRLLILYRLEKTKIVIFELDVTDRKTVTRRGYFTCDEQMTLKALHVQGAPIAVRQHTASDIVLEASSALVGWRMSLMV